jgi:ParB family chromosome partitioning protein
MSSQFFGDSVFWIEVEKVKPNPYQPRHEFDDARLSDLAESIRMYGILQPLVVTRREFTKDDGGMGVEYELISGERRLRASKLAGLAQVPALIRSGQEDARVKLELAIIENLQREDLNPVDRAVAFERLAKEFSLTHAQIAEKMGKSREYVTNSLRLLTLPTELLTALSEGKISEGHTRPLMMLKDRPEEQMTLYKEILFKKLTVREAEGIARRIAVDRVRKKDRGFDPDIVEFETKLTESLGTRVQIERRDVGGKIMIDFFSNDDLQSILKLVGERHAGVEAKSSDHMMENFISKQNAPMDDSTPEVPKVEAEPEDPDMYSVKNFVV